MNIFYTFDGLIQVHKIQIRYLGINLILIRH